MTSPPQEVFANFVPPTEIENEKNGFHDDSLSKANKNNNNGLPKKLPSNTTEAFKFIQEKLDSIENKLTLINDKIVSLKNSITKYEQN
ncbi:13650_t:CDS:2 [Funneliformis geosporum]|nr:13650_t:CDS:2 [Funneliformis geosporum]